MVERLWTSPDGFFRQRVIVYKFRVKSIILSVFVLRDIFLAQAEVMAYLVKDGQAYLFDKLLFRGADGLDVTLVKHNPFGKLARRAAPFTLKPGYAVKKPEKLFAWDIRVRGVLDGGIILHDNDDVLHTLPELVGEAIERPCGISPEIRLFYPVSHSC